MKGSMSAAGVVSVVVPLVVFQALGPGLPPALGLAPDMVKVTGGELKAERGGEPKGPEEESECGLGGGLNRILLEE